MILSNTIFYVLLLIIPISIFAIKSNKKETKSPNMQCMKQNMDQYKPYPIKLKSKTYNISTNRSDQPIKYNMINSTDYSIFGVKSGVPPWTDYEISKYPDTYNIHSKHDPMFNIQYNYDINKDNYHNYEKDCINGVNFYKNNDNLYGSIQYCNDSSMVQSNVTVKQYNNIDNSLDLSVPNEMGNIIPSIYDYR